MEKAFRCLYNLFRGFSLVTKWIFYTVTVLLLHLVEIAKICWFVCNHLYFNFLASHASRGRPSGSIWYLFIFFFFWEIKYQSKQQCKTVRSLFSFDFDNDKYFKKNFQNFFLNNTQKKKTFNNYRYFVVYPIQNIKELMMFEVVYRKLLVTNVKKKKTACWRYYPSWSFACEFDKTVTTDESLSFKRMAQPVSKRHAIYISFWYPNRLVGPQSTFSIEIFGCSVFIDIFVTVIKLLVIECSNIFHVRSNNAD